MGVGFAPKTTRDAAASVVEGQAAAGQLLDLEQSLDGRLDVELLDDVRLLADELSRPARQLGSGGLCRLPDVDGAPALVGSSEIHALNRSPGTSENASTDSSRR